uniref:leucine-rich repeat and guanylate kinase domain-containing protein-like n=1 Tax=Ciona intestinalis TaxID=7719 RepID=UPI000180C695|nr:leucine-rich repeat and guanylate kinase domain-containing protein-like [Ciona intestinalis]|eukprot:XP_002129189.3 leucine-rich repeat and guanylate kinase domain-containing protein-like [Ciona intestinalis]
MKHKPKGKKSRSPSPRVKDVEVGKAVDLSQGQGMGIDAQKLTLSESNILNPNQVLGPDADLTLFIPDDASSIMEEEEDPGRKISVLTQKLISRGLSNIGTSACGTMHVFLKLNLQGIGLEDISALKSLQHIQELDLSHNNLTDLSALRNMRYLVKLNVSHNELTEVLDFEPPFGLREANFSHNNITKMPGLSTHGHLSILNLEHNRIEEVEGLSNCSYLQKLVLSRNLIQNISGFENLNLRVLELAHNKLTQIENLETVQQLQELDLSGNNLFSLCGLEGMNDLCLLNCEGNQLSDLAEIQYIESIQSIRTLNFVNNPMVEAEEYRKSVIFAMQQITELDGVPVSVEEKVMAVNLFDPPPEVQAALDHITHTVYRFLQPSKIYESTLPSIEMPYPMLVLTGPQASGKRELAHRLAQEFPDYFGFGVSHTTRVMHPGETNGKEYHFVTPNHFQALLSQGYFVQTYRHSGCLYGLSLDAIESVAKEGLACVVHMEINGVRTLKNTYFEPRYVLILPVSKNEHKARMIERGLYTKDQVKHISEKQTAMYAEINQENPGFFDMVINSDKLGEAYDRLRQLVMDYLGTTDLSGADAEVAVPRLSTTEHKEESGTHQTTLSGHMRRTWSRPSFHGDSTNSNDPNSAKNQIKLDSRKTPVEEASYRRRQNAAKEAVEGFSPSVYDELFRRPMVPMTAPGMLEGSPMAQAASLYQDPAFAASMYPNMSQVTIENGQNYISDKTKSDRISPDSSNSSNEDSTGLSGLSSARGFSDEESCKDQTRRSKPNAPVEFSDQPLDLGALNDALESLKGSLKDSSRTATPLAPRIVDGLEDWMESFDQPDKPGANIKPVLPPIPTGGR